MEMGTANQHWRFPTRRPKLPQPSIGSTMRKFITLSAVAIMLAGCSPAEEPFQLGPHDGHELAATDLERIQVGQEAPDFSLLSFTGDTVTLSDYRGTKTVVLQFYRGHW